MKLHSVKTKEKKRIGRGLSAGQGKTAGRGTKGQKSRAGHNIPNRHEGGQTPLSMRLPKLPGFKSVHKKATVVSLDEISANYKNNELVSLASLADKKIISSSIKKIKILNNGKLTVKPLLSKEIKVSKSIEKLFENNTEKKTEVAETKKVVEEKSKTKKAATEKTAAKKISPK